MTHIDKKIVAEKLFVCSSILTQEFCETSLNSLMDAWLLRKHIVSGESMINFYPNTATERLRFYDCFGACDSILVFMAFSDLVGAEISTEQFNFQYFKKIVNRYDNRNYTEYKIEILDMCFKLFWHQELEPFLSADKPLNSDFFNDMALMIFDCETKPFDYFEAGDLIEITQIVEKFKRVFVKYYLGAYLHLDKYEGMYCNTDSIHKLKKSKINNYRLSKKQLADITECDEQFNSEKVRPAISTMLLNADVQSMYCHLAMEYDDKMKESHHFLYQSFSLYDGIFDKYETIRGGIEGDILRTMMLTIALEYYKGGGYSFDHGFKFK